MGWPVEEAYGEALAAIRARIEEQWVSGPNRLTLIQFPRVPGLLPLSGSTLVSEPPVGAEWLKVDVVAAPTTAAAFCKGHGQNRNCVFIYLTVYVPNKTTNAPNRLIELSGLARKIFSRQHTGDGLRPDQSSLPRDLPEERGCIVAQVSTRCWFYEEVI
jgi:hypothetical protein